MNIKGHSYLVLMLTVVFLFCGTVGYAQIKAGEDRSVTSILRKMISEFIEQVEGQVNKFKSDLRDWKAQRERKSKGRSQPVVSDLKQKLSESRQQLNENMQKLKSDFDGLRTQQKQMKEQADQSKQKMREQSQKFKQDLADMKRQQQDAKDRMTQMRMRQRQQMRSF